METIVKKKSLLTMELEKLKEKSNEKLWYEALNLRPVKTKIELLKMKALSKSC
jgi:FtsZ-binding cell division protein ZapB